MSITQERLKSVMFYLPKTGRFYWKERGRGRRVDAAAGSMNADGYINIGIDGGEYYAHRLVWLYEFGRWPLCVIDHINGIRSDNRLENLREATQSENIGFVVAARSDSKIGLRGVSLHKQSGKFAARIKANGIYKHIGLFKTPEEAAIAYADAKKRLHGVDTDFTAWALDNNIQLQEAA